MIHLLFKAFPLAVPGGAEFFGDHLDDFASHLVDYRKDSAKCASCRVWGVTGDKENPMNVVVVRCLVGRLASGLRISELFRAFGHAGLEVRVTFGLRLTLFCGECSDLCAAMLTLARRFRLRESIAAY